MGLAGPKRRSKIGTDPNNNNWAKATDSFGHKILASQGWKPGDTLGAKDANHASHYTVGSNSHIRVLLKDDNLGLGAVRVGNNAETFGLSLYSGLLGRLNGKSEAEVEKQQTAQRDIELAVYQGRKFGNINFVSAGFLVGDKMDLKSTVMPNVKLASQEPALDAANKKRKRSDPEQQSTNDASSDSDSSRSDEDEDVEEAPKSKKIKESKRGKKSKKSSSKDASSDSTDEPKSKDERKKEKKDKKRKASDVSGSEDETRAEKKARKVERRAKKEAKKEEKRKRKEEKKAAKSGTATPSTAPGTPAESAPVAALYGRQNVRSRYIAQKRLAFMDPQAMKEVCSYTSHYTFSRLICCTDFHGQSIDPPFLLSCFRSELTTTNPSVIDLPFSLNILMAAYHRRKRRKAFCCLLLAYCIGPRSLNMCVIPITDPIPNLLEKPRCLSPHINS
jgi:Pin2-interacting protein X1